MSATTPLRPVAVAAAAVAVVVIAGAIWLLADSDEPGWSSDGITLNTSSWEPGDDADQAAIINVVRIDPNGCVYLRREGRDVGVDIIWPAGYTAARRSDGTVAILDPDGVVVAATGHRIRAGGGEPPPDVEFACRAQNADGNTPFMIQDELPPLSDSPDGREPMSKSNSPDTPRLLTWPEGPAVGMDALVVGVLDRPTEAVGARCVRHSTNSH